MTGGGEGDMRGVFVDPVVCMTVAEVSIEEVSEAFAVTLQHLSRYHMCCMCIYCILYTSVFLLVQWCNLYNLECCQQCHSLVLCDFHIQQLHIL